MHTNSFFCLVLKGKPNDIKFLRKNFFEITNKNVTKTS